MLGIKIYNSLSIREAPQWMYAMYVAANLIGRTITERTIPASMMARHCRCRERRWKRSRQMSIATFDRERGLRAGKNTDDLDIDSMLIRFRHTNAEEY